MPKRIGKYELGRTLGQGNFSKVKYCVNTEDPNLPAFAIKVIDRQEMKKQNMEAQLKSEIAIMKLLKCPYIVQLKEVLLTQKHIYMVLELVVGGELFDRIVKAKRFDEATGRRYFQQLVLGLKYCHSKGVAHRDLKPENLLLDSNDNIKISDFGLSSLQVGSEKQLLNTTCGTPNYVAPEIIQEKPYDGFIADVWSCGVILFVMLAGYLPFDDPNSMNGLFNKIERGEYRIPRHFTPPIIDIIGKMLKTNPAERITISKLVEEPWFEIGLDKNVLPQFEATPEEKKEMDEAKKGGGTFKEVDESETSDKATPAGPSVKMSAFELTSRLMMGSLTPFARGREKTIRRGTRVMVNGSFKEVISAIADSFGCVNFQAKVNEAKCEVKGIGSTGHGVMVIAAVVFPTVSERLCFVEFWRQRGDTLDFHTVFRKLCRAMGRDRVPCEPEENKDSECGSNTG